MLKLSKKVEYAIIAMQHMAMHPQNLHTAKQIAENKNLSYEFLAKSLQCLNKKGLINSQQGTRGGYTLARPPKEITVADIIDALEQKTAIVDCTKNDMPNKQDCYRIEYCTLKDPMHKIQEKIDRIFEDTTISEITPAVANVGDVNGNGTVTV